MLAVKAAFDKVRHDREEAAARLAEISRRVDRLERREAEEPEA